MKYGLIGEKLGHSHSATLHGLLGCEDYRLTPIARDELDAFLKQRDFLGLNVTIPYKQAVIPYCAELGETARKIGSVNTLVKRADGTLFGDNTDAFGFAKMAESAGISFADKKVLVLGSGGTSLTACHVVREAGGEAIVVSRNGEHNYDNLDVDADVIVNATPVGMFPNTDAQAVDLERFEHLSGVLDVIYNPLRTALLQQAETLHIPNAGGLTMLVWQAVRARELFDGRTISLEEAQAAEAALRKQVTSLVLIGMPGVGKSSLGKQAARALRMPLVDCDNEIVKAAGKPIPDIFAQDGEQAFRDIESRVIAEFGRKGGIVLVTGGGAVLREENRRNLRLNGVVVRLTRPVELLPTQGRPLSQSIDNLRQMAERREPMYRACADVTIRNSGSFALCKKNILEAYDEALRR